MIEIGRGNPAADAVPYQELAEAAQRASRDFPESLNQYLDPAGFSPLREHLAEKFDCYAIDQVAVGNGSIELLTNLCRVLHQRDPEGTALMEQPSYDLAVEVLPNETGAVTGVSMQVDGIDLEALEKILRKRRAAFLYTIPDFQNPTGASLSMEKRLRLVDMAGRHGFWIVEDAAYRELRYSGLGLPTLHQLAPDRVLHLGSFSKTIAPGLRVGFLVGNKKIINAVVNSARQRRLFPNTFSQAVIYSLLLSGNYDPHVAGLREMYKERLELLMDHLQTALPTAVQWPAVEGGFFVGLLCPRLAGKPNFSQVARREGISLLEGDAFFVEPDAEQFFVRLAFPRLSSNEIRQVAVRLGNTYHTHLGSEACIRDNRSSA